jgi:hypothetical protein
VIQSSKDRPMSAARPVSEQHRRAPLRNDHGKEAGRKGRYSPQEVTAAQADSSAPPATVGGAFGKRCWICSTWPNGCPTPSECW